MFSSTPLASRATLHPGDPQLLSMWRRGLPPSARGALWCMAIGNRLGLSDDDFDARVAAANADAAAPAADSGVVPGAAAGANDSAAEATAAAAAAAATFAIDETTHDGDDKAEREALLRAQIEMDLQRTMPR